MRTPANRARDDEARDERGSGDDVPVETASWAGATDAERREWLRSGVVPVDYPGPVAADWPELLGIVGERVKPERMKVNRKLRRDRWWQFGDTSNAGAWNTDSRVSSTRFASARTRWRSVANAPASVRAATPCVWSRPTRISSTAGLGARHAVHTGDREQRTGKGIGRFPLVEE